MIKNSFKKTLLTTASAFTIGAFAATGANAAVVDILATTDLTTADTSYTYSGATSFTASDTANLAFGNIT